MNRRLSLSIGLSLMAPYVLGCASFMKFNGQQIAATSTWVRVKSTPPGAVVRSPDGRSHITPCNVVLPSDEDVELTVLKEGFQPQRVRLRSRLNHWIWGNLLPIPLPLVGFFVDADQGASRTLRPSDVEVRLVPSAAVRDSPGASSS